MAAQIMGHHMTNAKIAHSNWPWQLWRRQPISRLTSAKWLRMWDHWRSQSRRAGSDVSCKIMCQTGPGVCHITWLSGPSKVHSVKTSQARGHWNCNRSKGADLPGTRQLRHKHDLERGNNVTVYPTFLSVFVTSLKIISSQNKVATMLQFCPSLKNFLPVYVMTWPHSCYLTSDMLTEIDRPSWSWRWSVLYPRPCLFPSFCRGRPLILALFTLKGGP